MAGLIKKILKSAADKLTNRNTLYYPGCITKFALPQNQEKYKEILKKLKVEFIMLKDKELCCGSPALHAGYKKDFQKIKAKNKEIFSRFGVGKIITNCPGCFHMFSTEYGIKTEHITQTIAKRLKKTGLKQHKGNVSYHDPCHLGRMSDVYEEPRQVIRAAGFDLHEMQNSKKDAVCCGGGGGLKSNYPDTANQAAKNRLKMSRTKKIITTCPMCYLHMKENSKENEMIELSEVIDL